MKREKLDARNEIYTVGIFLLASGAGGILMSLVGNQNQDIAFALGLLAIVIGGLCCWIYHRSGDD